MLHTLFVLTRSSEVERLTVNQDVVGSIPTTSVRLKGKRKIKERIKLYGK